MAVASGRRASPADRHVPRRRRARCASALRAGGRGQSRRIPRARCAPRALGRCRPFPASSRAATSWPAARGSACGATGAGRWSPTCAKGRATQSGGAVARRAGAGDAQRRVAPADGAGCASMRNAARYNGFNLLAGDGDGATWVSNRAPDGAASCRRRARPVERAARHAVAEVDADPGRARVMGRARRRRLVAVVRRAGRSHAGAAMPTCPRRACRSNGSGCCRRRSSSATTTARAARRCWPSIASGGAALRRALVRRAWQRRRRSRVRVRRSAPKGLTASSTAPRHRPVRNARLQIFVAVGDESVARIERHRVRLRVQDRARWPRDARELHQLPQQRRTRRPVPATRPARPAGRCGRRAAGARSRPRARSRLRRARAGRPRRIRPTPGLPEWSARR